jgi:predicted MFS family arabinose efflux permease
VRFAGRLGPLAERQFRLLFAGRTVSVLGNAIAPIALAFAVLDLTGSKSDLGFVLAARAIPQVLFILVGGIWADRLKRNQVMVASNILSGATQAVVAALLLTGTAQVWMLIVLAAVNGFAGAFFFPASVGIVPQTVSATMLQSANALLRLGLNATNIVGAAIGGVLVAATSPGTAIAVDAVTFFVGALLIGLMSLPAGLRMEESHFLGELAEGWREFRSRTWLWAIVVQFGVVNAAIVGAQSVLGPVVAKQSLGGAAGWGLILTCESAGLLLGGILQLRLRPRRLLLVATLGVMMNSLVMVGLAVPLALAAVCVCALLAGIGLETFGVNWDTALQQEIPGEKLSRVSSYDALGSWVLIPLGLALAGPIADAIGTSTTLYAVAVLNVGAALAVLSVRRVRTLRRVQPAITAA